MDQPLTEWSNSINVFVLFVVNLHLEMPISHNRRRASACAVMSLLSVCLSVRLSRCGIVSKRMHTLLNFFHLLVVVGQSL